MGYSKMVIYGDYVEIYDYEKTIFKGNRARQKGGGKRGKKIRFLTRRPDSIYRLKRNFVRFVGANITGVENPALFTFTMLEVVSLDDAYLAFTASASRYRRQYKDFRYIAVPEFQKRGAVHFHALVWGIPHDEIKKEGNKRSLQALWGYGYLDCIPTNGSIALARYLGKYMSKAMQDRRLVGKKAYTASRSCMRQVSFPLATPDEELSTVLGLETPLQDKRFDTQWLGEGRYRLYKRKINHEN